MNGLLVCAGEAKYKNIGDYVQSVAQEQFWHHIDCYVEREQLNSYVSKENTNLIMNAWYMWHPENFPPSDSINPLFVSIHIAPNKAEKMLSSQTIDYLKKYEPIGARDIGTRDILIAHGIKSYFSGCLTLTLGNTFKKYKAKVGGVIFVDPFCEIGGRSDKSRLYRMFRALYLCVKYRRKIRKLISTFAAHTDTRIGRISKKFEKLLFCASFYDTYSQLFSDEVLFEAEYITHELEQSMFNGHDDKMEYARALIKKYAQAKYVVTSRIHCALPCLGVETPVLFVTSENLETGKARSGGRFGGLLDFFHVVRYSNQGLKIESEEIKRMISNSVKIGKEFSFKNKENYKSYAKELTEKVCAFVSSFGGQK